MSAIVKNFSTDSTTFRIRDSTTNTKAALFDCTQITGDTTFAFPELY